MAAVVSSAKVIHAEITLISHAERKARQPFSPLKGSQGAHFPCITHIRWETESWCIKSHDASMGCTQLSTVFLPNLPRHLAYPETIPQIGIWYVHLWFPRWLSVKESACQCRSHRRHGFDPWNGRSPGGGNGTPVLVSVFPVSGSVFLYIPVSIFQYPNISILSGKIHGQRSLAGYIGHGVTRSRTQLSMRMYTCALYALSLTLIYITKHFLCLNCIIA